MRALKYILATTLLTVAAGWAQELPVPAASGPPASVVGDDEPAQQGRSRTREEIRAALTELHLTVYEIPRSQAIRISETRARPDGRYRYDMEVVDENNEFIYMRNLPPEDPDSSGYAGWERKQQREALTIKNFQRSRENFVLIPDLIVVPPPFTDRIRLEERSGGLPDEGRWQVGFALADMNGDGRNDLVFPPQRTGGGRPWILLGAEGGWRVWEEFRWPGVKLDYGDVGVADFDGDGNLDIAITCHFLRSYVLYGDGKGDFTRSIELPRTNVAVSSRALEIADFDGDGRPDVVLLAELDLDMGTSQAISSGLLQVCLNTASGWRVVDAAPTSAHVYGDHVAVGDFNGDGAPDILAASHSAANPHWIFLNGGDGRSFTPFGSNELPAQAFNFGPAAGDLDGRPGDEVFTAFQQTVWANRRRNPVNAMAIYSLVATDGDLTPTRTMIHQDVEEYRQYTCATIADIDGDGRNDFVVGRKDGSVRIFLQGVDGEFLEERSPELDLGGGYLNSVAVGALNRNGKERALFVNLSHGSAGAGGVRAFVIRENGS